jgi:hypothetical protein
VFEIKVTGAEAIEAELKEYPQRVRRALVRALNRAIASGRTVMVREIARDTGLTSKVVRDALPVQEASVNRPEARLAASLKRIPLINFGARGPEPSRGRGRGVTYRLRGGRNRVERAFIARMQSQHRGVFVRVGKARLPIRELFGPSLGHVFAKFRPAALARIREAFDKNFAHELGFQKSRGSSDE